MKRETTEQKEGFLGMLLGNLGISLLGNIMQEKELQELVLETKKKKEL